MTNYKAGRHAPAFILLFLATEPGYGSSLLSQMKELMPHNKLDSAVIYRSLQELEKLEAVESYWDTSTPGPAKKWYQITAKGWQKLEEYKQDIQMRKNNLEFFLKTFEDLKEKGDT